MKEVKVTVEELLVKVRANREKHKEELADAMGEMLTDLAQYHYRQLELLKGDIDDLDDVDTHFSFPVPEDHTEDYDQVITMLEMSVDKEITLDHHEFQQYVMDKWVWKNDHLRTMAFYSKST